MKVLQIGTRQNKQVLLNVEYAVGILSLLNGTKYRLSASPCSNPSETMLDMGVENRLEA